MGKLLTGDGEGRVLALRDKLCVAEAGRLNSLRVW